MQKTEQLRMLKVSEELLENAEKQLSDAIKSGDMCKVSVASCLLEVGRKRIREANEKIDAIIDNRKKLKA